MRNLDPLDPVDAVTLAWQRERPDTPSESIGVVTRIWRIAKLLGDDRRRTVRAAGSDAATLDLLSVLRRCGPPYELTTRDLADRTMVTAGAISQRLTRAEQSGLVRRRAADTGRAVLVALTPAGHDLVEELVGTVLGREIELLSGLGLDQQEDLAEQLRILLDQLQGRLGPAAPGPVGEPS